MKLLEKGKDLVSEVRTHWKEPKEGYYIPYKELAAYSFGGIGISTINCLFGYVALAANCLLMGSVYNIKPTHLAYMGIIMGIINVIKTPFISMIIDNTNTKYGKFRPYILWTGVPTIVLLIGLAFIPLDTAYTAKCVIICVVYAFLMIFQSLYATAFSSLAQVMTPDGNERNNLLSISAFIYNLGPSLVNMLLPVFAELTGGLTNITTYRILFPAFSILGVVLGMLTFKGSNERIIVKNDYVAKVKFSDGFSQVIKNKYFWIINLSSVLGALKYGVTTILPWYCVYLIKNDATLGLMYTIIGTASVPGMLLAPLIAKKIGKKNLIIFGNIIHAVFAFLMLVFMDKPVLFFICMYLSTLGTGGEYIATQSMLADVYDYQQLKTGKRLEGFIGQFGTMLTTVFGFVTALILPYFYEHYGLLDNYDVMFDPIVRTPIFNILIITTVISSVIAIVPVLFYDLTEQKHKEIIEELEKAAQQNEA